MITFIDFFAGVGGFRRGMELAGHKCIGFCEFDKYAVASYTSMHLITEKQREYLGTLDMKKRQKEILKEEYRNGEWYASDVRTVRADDIPRADCWCFGFPCQDISVAGKQLGFAGHRSSLFFAVTNLVRDLEEKDRPQYLFIENVKNLLSVNGGFDFAKLLVELDEIGYDAEWAVLNSKNFGVPQNRERVFIVGHLRGRRGGEIFPVEGTNGENRVSIIGHRDGYRTNLLTFTADGIVETMKASDGGGNGNHVALPCFCDMNYGAGVILSENARCIQSRYNKGVSGRQRETSGVCIPVMTPDRVCKRQNGRRVKENGEPMFTLTGADIHGIAIEPLGGIYANVSAEFQHGILEGCARGLKANKHDSAIAIKVKEATKKQYVECNEGDAIDLKGYCSSTRRGVVKEQIAGTLDRNCNQGIIVKVGEDKAIYGIWYEKYQCYIAIRKLTPKECFRLQGWTDDYFEKAAFVNSNSQLYKQAGNGVTVNVIEAIARKMEGEHESDHQVSGEQMENC